LSPTTIFTIKDSIVACTSTVFTDLAPGLQPATPVSTIGGAFYIKNAAGVFSTRNEIKYCHLADVGAAFYLENTVFTDGSVTSKFTKNAALKGGAIYCKSCTLTITNSILSGNQA
jgi:predicted outer membrane repeat protein